MKTTTSHMKEIVMQGVFTACACISILAVALICIFLFANGLPTITGTSHWIHIETFTCKFIPPDPAERSFRVRG